MDLRLCRPACRRKLLVELPAAARRVAVCREGETVGQLALPGSLGVVLVEVERAHAAVNCHARQGGTVDAAREANFDRRRQVLVRDGRQIIAALIGPAGGGCALGLVVGAGVVAVSVLAVLAATRALRLELGDQAVGAHTGGVVALARRASVEPERPFVILAASWVVRATRFEPGAVAGLALSKPCAAERLGNKQVRPSAL
mmetsp:Transcript_11665/g.37248  ORF Transcript_11665/g.37248 Transcript_11665/m.37248 type:complete len:201 (-) Transcript_11665:481-1083(-)